MMLCAGNGRSISYLRLSITDRCNLRCRYCMPPQGVEPLACQDILRYEEILRVVKLLANLGVTKVRVTGGEPLVRQDVVQLVSGIKGVPEIKEVALTTNGIRLQELAAPLKAAGLDRINLSLDTLDAQRYRELTRGGSLNGFWAGVNAATMAGFERIKINMVVMKGFNEDELGAMAALAQENPWQIRYIEYMPMGGVTGGWNVGYMPAWEIQAETTRQLAEILGQDREWLAAGIKGTARVYQVQGFQGSIGFISPIGEHFCESCNRLRLSADGILHSCLLEEGSSDLKALLRTGASDEEIIQAMRVTARLKPEHHAVTLDDVQDGRKKMSRVGG